MIKIQRSNKPSELTNDVVKNLTDEFKKTKKTVWDKPYIKKALLDMSHGKCAYCEVDLTQESNYMHVEHFHHKDKYPDEVLQWDNLLPSCPHCNVNKSDHDTYKEPIIDPTIQDPKDYLYIETYRYKALDNNQLGKTTIDVLDLNVSDKKVMPRFQIGESIIKKMESIVELIKSYETTKSTRSKNKLVNTLKETMRQGDRTKAYSALVATLIIQDANYSYIKNSLNTLGLWDVELVSIEKELEEIALVNKNFSLEETKELITLLNDHTDDSVPVYSCSAGDGIMVDSTEPINYAIGGFPSDTDFFVKINGESMEPLIPNGSFVPIRKKEPEHNKMCIFSLDGQFMCKKYIQNCADKIILEALNPDFDNITLSLSELSDKYVYYGEVICRFHNKPYVYYSA